ncbi:phage tail spike protein [Leuconostoc mesenteroides]|uniref:phage tail spike protein n=1 Tax=Leuconostoc mesenteroides TaxID=1245 RepID=UPI002362EBF5|nr:phage tail spike protein [Leuconostoc mesenteroides]
MIYIFDKTQAIIKVLTNDDFTAAHLNFKINTATTFEFSLPASKALPSGSKYVATPHPLNDSKFIMLRLTERVDNTETIDYSAYELAYQELATDGYIEDKRPAETDAKTLMKIALNGTNWELNNVNVAGTAKTNFYYTDHLSAISSVVDLLGGEIVFYIEIQGNAISGRYMDYIARQGADTSKVFASGSNLLTVERQSDTSNIYTAILPRGKGEEIDNGKADTPDGYGRRINISDVEWKRSAGKPLDKPKGSIVLSDPDATAEWGQINGNARLLLKTYDDVDDVNVLINSAYKTLQSVNHPQIQYSATVADVGGLSLGDTVLIMHGDRDLSYKTRVFEVKYDLLSPDQTELSLGDDLSSNSITSQINNLNTVADTTSSQTQWTINQIGRPGTTYGATAPDSPKVGDIWFKHLPDGGTEIYRWNGDIWELLASPTTADDIAKAVDDAVSQAKSHTDEVKQVLSTDIETAKSQAASLANAAEANAKSEATSLFSRAQNALSDAKTDLTKSISSEASKAVAAANSQAQAYVNQAKSNINDTINALSVGGRNYVLNTNVSTASNITGFYSSVPSSYFNHKKLTVSVQLDYDNITELSGQKRLGVEFAILNKDGSNRLISSWKYPAIGDSFHGRIYTTFDFSNNEFKDYATNQMVNGIYVQGITGTNVSVSKPKLEIGTKATDWTPAPEDVVLDYTTKDNQIKEIISQYQTTNDGKVTKAQTDVTTALGQIATKISQTDYNQKNGELSEKINDVKDTADKSLKTIADIQRADNKQNDRMAEIENTAGELKNTVSDLSTAQEKQSGFISTLKQRADGFDATVTKVDNLAVGGRNLLLNSAFLNGFNNWNNENNSWTIDSSTYQGNPIIKSPATTGSGSRIIQRFTNPPASGSKVTVSFNARGNDSNSIILVSLFNTNTVNIPLSSSFSRYTVSFTIPNDFGVPQIYFWNKVAGNNVFLNSIKVDVGNVATDWTPAPEDVDSATAKAQLTADEASAAVTKLTNADGIITKAQADIKANADAITEKVSKTVYNQKTGDILQAISKAQSTADGAVSTVGNYQTSNDKRVKAAESTIEQHSKDITAKVSKTDYDDYKSTLNERFTKVEATADGASTTVSKLQQTVNSMGQINQLFNTEFSPDLQGWSSSNLSNYLDYIDIKGVYNLSHVLHYNGGTTSRLDIQSQKIKIENPTQTFSISVLVKGKVGISVVGYKSDGDVAFSSWYTATSADSNYSDWTLLTFNNKSIIGGSTTAIASIAFNITSTGNEFWLSQPMLVFASTVGSYVQGNYNNNAALAQVKITADGISNFVRDSSGNISSDFQTALSKTSIITGSTLASSIKTQTATQISSAITDNNGKIISLINQDTSGVQIAGKNLAITADTTVDGNFWAKQVNAVRVNATNITAGTLNASDVNIINLDVNSLTGNVSKFLQSNWNGEFGSVSIDPFSMTVSTFGVTTEFSNTGMSLRYANELAGGIGVQGWENMPSNYQGLHISLNGLGDFMSFGARDNGVQTGLYTSKLAWMRGAGYARPIGMSSGWTFMDDVKFNNFIIPNGTSNQKMVLGSIKFDGNDYPYFGDSRNNAGLAYGSSQIYLVSDDKYYNLTSVITGLSGLGSIKIPKEIGSDGTVTQWASVST